jgi:cytochrome c556
MRDWLVLYGLAALFTLGMDSFLTRTAFAHEGAAGVVKQRMDAMRVIKNERKIIRDMLSGKKYLSRRRLMRSLNILKSHSGAAMTKLFPKGSDGLPSEAAPKIWQDWSGFEKEAQQFEAAIEGFLSSAAAKAPKERLVQDLGKVHATCKSCHDAFRL